MSSIQKKLYDLVVAMLVDEKVVDEAVIDEEINMFIMLPKFRGKISDEDIKVVRNKITSERSIKLEQGRLIECKEKHEKWFLKKKSELDMKYWERYRKHLIYDKGFPTNVVNTMDDILDRLTDLLGNPMLSSQFQRRGLIIGDVQSGKTSNYTGLICKGSDAGYKVIVLLTGTIEKLRKQTQLRIDEGFVGMDSAAIIKQIEDSKVGVGNFDSSIRPMVLTSTTDDFKIKTARNLGFNLKTINEPVIFVVKKNVSSLRNLNRWLRTFNQNGEEKIDHSLLLIDDESDNASVNTNAEDKNPTSINAQIRDLLNVFTKSSYVGFTATPFANIFIDPDTNDNMLKEDLFPKDYIYSLNAPSNYIGARDIFAEGGKYNGMLVNIDEEEIQLCLPIQHKSTDDVTDIPEDLKEAVCTFLVANVIRDLRCDVNKHRSMLINVSRFTDIQKQINDLVNSYLKNIQSAARLYSQLEASEALKNKYINKLYQAYRKFYSSTEFDWEQIQPLLYKSIAPVTVLTVNQKSKDALNYEEYGNDGLRVIAVGGLSLSRGLTLEGLIISYIYRNSKMYDTLMQMGRWFGYRKNYEDLCKIWMTGESIRWYEHISEATDELRNEIKKHENSGLTPSDFGLRVRSDINTLLVTARNKMRTASSMDISITLSGEVVETPNLYADIAKNNINLIAVENMIRDIEKERYETIESKKSFVFKDVNIDVITELLSNIEISLLNTWFNVESIKEFIENYEGQELKKWDIAFVSGSSEREFPKSVNRLRDKEAMSLRKRSYSLVNDNKILRMSGSKNRLGAMADGRLGLSDEQIAEVYDAYIDNGGKSENIPQKEYFRYIPRNPLLIVYMVELYECKSGDKEVGEKIKKQYKEQDKPLVGFSIGIPQLENRETKYARYTINKIHQMLLEEYDIGEEE